MQKKKINTPLRVLFSGRLAPEKRVNILLEATKIALDKGVDLELTVVGNGNERENLQQLSNKLGIQDKINFIGDLPYEKSLKWFEWADCLVLPSQQSEGWPKVIAEAMCYGVICVGVSHGQVSSMLEGKGILIEKGSSVEIANALVNISNNPNKYLNIGQLASKWSMQYSLEGLRDELIKLLSKQWKVSFRK
jgi:glycosyltransferase involved in cell wall biosynthesis